MNHDIIEALKQIDSDLEMNINEKMSRHTTFKTGGPASLFIRPDSLEQLKKVVALLKRAEVSYFILGNGSNLLVSDKGYDGAIISTDKFTDIRLEDEKTIYAEAGVKNSAIAAFARDNSLTGFEFAAGIPGSLGGAVIMNAGAYGGEMKLIVKEVRALSPQGEIIRLDNEALRFDYRTSALKGKDFIVISALLELEKGDKDEISAQMNELALKRKEKQPLEYPSAGSTFKRPEGYFAGKLIEDSGLRGYTVGGAMVSDKHCGFVINKGEATSKDIYTLILNVQNTVYEKFGVRLEPEVILLGKF
ncbi:UDP-N-acetylenolpyruvoylglucosamine reductase MurB [Butyrivibrio proteoclasticus B316]|uniref:UDP-N-acetylenolpyruvoylglucosamine reductase n=1 Tax=Butyrivibrio proteoclasticus (strain ATCC 51982 / DSM 14932 / B316) TaxID=515622 RepID=E0RUG2_BUTPB|nr:UDP-N-acetylmuramate dehydrogenase [Butyrivibrio proteoclasticus]ADL32852.1 UDP-N-acetylenolpyruvoylglucosamine reductase MurB [Butyrivibrio proteoclasticus B316]